MDGFLVHHCANKNARRRKKAPLIFSHLLLWPGRERKSWSHVSAFAKFARIARPRVSHLGWVMLARAGLGGIIVRDLRIGKGIVKD
jgi:hypothetical protein